MQPQITPDTPFGKALTQLAVQSRTIVEIGTGCGLGSTLSLFKGLHSPNQRIITYEADPKNYDLAKANIRDKLNSDLITLRNNVLHRTIKPFWHPIKEYVPANKEMWEHEKKLTKNSLIQIHTIDQPIDLLLLDGGEYTSEGDFLLLWQQSKWIAMDDSHEGKAVKNYWARQQLIMAGWTVLEDHPEDRNGWFIAERPFETAQ